MAKAIDKAYLLANLKNFDSKILENKYLQTADLGVVKLTTAEEGFLSSYQIQVDGSAVGATINIPKDFLVKSATVKTATADNAATVGVAEGKKYIDFVVNSKDNTATDEHLYLALDDLINLEAGNGITVDGAKISVKAKTNGGLTVDADGVAVSVGDGITLTTDGKVKAVAKSNSGIEVTSDGIGLLLDKGLEINSNNKLAISLGNGLELGATTDTVNVKVGKGLTFDNDYNIAVNPGTGIKIVDGDEEAGTEASIALDLSAADTSVTVSGATVAVNYGTGLKLETTEGTDKGKLVVDVDSIIQFEDTNIDFDSEWE